jgi:hypothetical protein
MQSFEGTLTVLPSGKSYEVAAGIVSEFETEEQESSYNLWFRAKVEEALRSKKPRLPHDTAIAKVQAKLEERRQACANNSVD